MHQFLTSVIQGAGLPYAFASVPSLEVLINTAIMFGRQGKLKRYCPPHPNIISNKFAKIVSSNIQKNVFETLKSSVGGIEIASDGWGKRHPLLNFIGTSKSGSFFLRIVDTGSMAAKNSDFYFNTFKTVGAEVDDMLQEIGDVVQEVLPPNPNSSSEMKIKWPSRICALALDGAHVGLDGARKFLNLSIRSSVLLLKCGPHTTSTIMKDIGAIEDVKELRTDSLEIIKFFKNRGRLRFLLSQQTNKGVLNPPETRFAFESLAIARLYELKDSLLKVIKSDGYRVYKAAQGVDDHLSLTVMEGNIKDNLWWEKVKEYLSLVEPIYALLRTADMSLIGYAAFYHYGLSSLIAKMRKNYIGSETDNVFVEAVEAVKKRLLYAGGNQQEPGYLVLRYLNPVLFQINRRQFFQYDVAKAAMVGFFETIPGNFSEPLSAELARYISMEGIVDKVGHCEKMKKVVSSSSFLTLNMLILNRTLFLGGNLKKKTFHSSHRFTSTMELLLVVLEPVRGIGAAPVGHGLQYGIDSLQEKQQWTFRYYSISHCWEEQ
jgi:hypothetical protein